MYACYVFLPLGIATSSFRIVAMMITLPASRLILGDRITALKVVGVAIGSIGLLLVCKPDLFFQTTNEGDYFDNTMCNITTLPPLNTPDGTTATAASEKPVACWLRLGCNGLRVQCNSDDSSSTEITSC